MDDRNALASAFLQGTDWAGARRTFLAGDASNRRYDRLTGPNTGVTAVFMDAPPEKGEDIRPFVQISKHLLSLGLSAPRIFAMDEDRGFMVLEDLGDDLFARVIPGDPHLELTLYKAAADVLVTLHSQPKPDNLSPYDPPLMTKNAALAFEWYRLGAGDAESPDRTAGFMKVMQSVLEQYAPDQSVMVQRDYHAENLLWLPDRVDVARVGLLDFQSATTGHPAYDLVSLLEDARRDVPLHIQNATLDHYIAKTGKNSDAFRTAYAVLGAQRNLRILGVFARLSMHYGKAHYVDFIPRVWGYLQLDLAHPALADLREIILHSLPVPTQEILKRLKDKCATVPTL